MKKLIAIVLALVMVLGLVACGGNAPETTAPAAASAISGVEDGVLTVGMECAYAPYNWTQPDDSNGAVPISGSSDYANGYDVMIAKAICEKIGYKLEVVDIDFGAIIPALAAHSYDFSAAGMTVTEERKQSVDFSDSYYTGKQVIIVRS